MFSHSVFHCIHSASFSKQNLSIVDIVFHFLQEKITVGLFYHHWLQFSSWEGVLLSIKSINGPCQDDDMPLWGGHFIKGWSLSVSLLRTKMFEALTAKTNKQIKFLFLVVDWTSLVEVTLSPLLHVTWNVLFKKLDMFDVYLTWTARNICYFTRLIIHVVVSIPTVMFKTHMFGLAS